MKIDQIVYVPGKGHIVCVRSCGKFYGKRSAERRKKIIKTND